ncbi:MAG TPA: hypothetical protein VHC63_11085 [Acidimicrobiales bacterium]|nr:hypothetical protein [Acidimicrobiales bacterium]
MTAEDAPITSLLSRVLVALTIETDNEFEHRVPHFTSNHGATPGGGVWLASYATYANFLRFVGDAGIAMGELATRAGYPPPVHPAWHGMRRWGYVTYTPDIAGPSPRKADSDAVVRATAMGARARDTWVAVLDDLAARWSARGLDALQAALIPIVADVERPLPEYVPTVEWGRRQPQLLQPVSRPPIELNLLGLLAQLLTAMTYDFEAKTPLSLATFAGLLEPLGDEPVPTRHLYERTGIATKEWSSAMKQLAEEGLVDVGGKPKTIALTEEGAAVCAEARRLRADVETAWAKQHGPSWEHLRHELARVVADAWDWTEPYPDNWRSRVKVPRRLAGHPVVSHRGGYPDGS